MSKYVHLHGLAKSEALLALCRNANRSKDIQISKSSYEAIAKARIAIEQSKGNIAYLLYNDEPILLGIIFLDEKIDVELYDKLYGSGKAKKVLKALYKLRKDYIPKRIVLRIKRPKPNEHKPSAQTKEASNHQGKLPQKPKRKRNLHPPPCFSCLPWFFH